VVKTQFFQTGAALSGDLNRDGVVNFLDLGIVKANFFRRAPGEAPPPSPTPSLLAAAAPAEAGPAIAASARIERGATIGKDVVIGEKSVIGRRARIGARARLGVGVVVERGAWVPADAIVLDGTVVRAMGRHARAH